MLPDFKIGTASRCDFARRGSGILLHLTSLPGSHGSGDLGPAAHRFLDFLDQAGQTWWQMLPVNPPGRGPGWSPYDSPSAFAGSPWLVSLEALAQDGLLSRQDLRPQRGLTARRVNFPAVTRYREARLRRAFTVFQGQRRRWQDAFGEFCATHAAWLDDYALFSALRQHFGGKPWPLWAAPFRRRQPAALDEARRSCSEEIDFHRFVQFVFQRQWQILRSQARRRGVGLIGDLPVFVAHDSADVWSHQELFELDPRGQPRWVSGYPPDGFNASGQRWGHPLYRWPAHRRTGFDWWVWRFARCFERFDALRVDHFLGFTRLWGIPAGACHTGAGRWVRTPGAELLGAVRERLGSRSMIAEDLGHVTPADVALRKDFGLLPMRVLQFGFDDEPDAKVHLPHNLEVGCVAYTGTHDNDTLVGWFRRVGPKARRRILAYLGGRPGTVHLDSVRALLSSAAGLVLFPLQDVLGLDSRARTNSPGTTGGNWDWRLPARSLGAAARTLRSFNLLFDRG